MKRIVDLIATSLTAFAVISVISAAQDGNICSISLGPDFGFGSLNAGSLSGEESLLVTNNGDLATTSLSVAGSAWTSASSFFDVSATHFSTASGNPYDSMSVLGSGSTLPNLDALSFQTIYFKVKIPDHQTSGNYSQSITFTVSCL